MEKSDNTIRIMTFNILVDKGQDIPYSWVHRRDQIVELIKYYNPDIFCLQEPLEHQKKYLEEHFTDYECYGIGRDDGNKEGEQVPIFYRKSLFELNNRGYFWLAENPRKPGSIGWDAKCPRTVMWELLKHKDSGKTFMIANTHYDHRGEKANINSAKVISQELSYIEPQGIKILCGDFNSSEQKSSYKEILSYGFMDAQKAAEAVCYGMPFTYHKFLMEQYKTESVRIMEEHERVFRTIDHIFYIGAIEILRYGILGDNQKGVYPSDHFPIICDIMLKDE